MEAKPKPVMSQRRKLLRVIRTPSASVATCVRRTLCRGYPPDGVSIH